MLQEQLLNGTIITVKICSSWIQCLFHYQEFLSYEGAEALRFLSHLKDNIPCPTCQQSENFGVHDIFCDWCIENMPCKKASTCPLKTFKNGKNLCPHFNFAAESLYARFWDYDTNYPHRPEHFTISSAKKPWFRCGVCDHIFDIALYNIRNHWCPYHVNQKLCGTLSCTSCSDKSFYSNAEHRDNWVTELNKKSPLEVFNGDRDEYWFLCECKHYFKATPKSVNRGVWCPYCSFPVREFCGCQTCLSNSFFSHEKCKYWNYSKNKEDPRKVFKHTNDKYWFNCPCGHEFLSTPHNVSTGVWCPYCCNPPKALCDNFSCQSCLKNSFFSYPQCIYWDYSKNLKHPRYVFRGTPDKYWLKCKEGHSFESPLSDITSKNRWCPLCKHKTEAKFLEWANIVFPNQCRRNINEICINPFTNRPLPYDFLIFNIIIELDGIQHFIQVSNWKSPNIAMKRDVYKMYIAILQRFHIIRISQEDVWKDSFDWRSILINTIQKLLNDPSPKCIYIENPYKTPRYDAHKELYNSISAMTPQECFNTLNFHEIPEEESKTS